MFKDPAAPVVPAEPEKPILGHRALAKYKGFSEAKNEAWIKEKWAEFGRPKYDKSTPWCSLCICVGETESGYLQRRELPKIFERARHWLKPHPRYDRVEAKDLKVGDIVILWRSNPKSSKGHVAYFAGFDRKSGRQKNGLYKKFWALGCNQSNQINRKRYMSYRILGGQRRKD